MNKVLSRKTLYLGLDPKRFLYKRREIIHFPIIKILPRSQQEIVSQLFNWKEATHFIFTSRTAAQIFIKYLDILNLEGKCVIAIGQATAELLPKCDWIAKNETAEGIVEILQHLHLADAKVLIPCSSLSRRVIPDFLEALKISFGRIVLYDTIPNDAKAPNLDSFSEIVFTSPSTVEAFLKIYGRFPPGKRLFSIGSITQKRLDNFLFFSYRYANHDFQEGNFHGQKIPTS